MLSDRVDVLVVDDPLGWIEVEHLILGLRILPEHCGDTTEDF